MPTPEQITAGRAALRAIQPFLSNGQFRTMHELMSDDGAFYVNAAIDFAARIAAMPATYEQRDVNDAVAHLHYFIGGCDAYITEKDIEGGVHQSYGIRDIGYGFSAGYICITEMVEAGAQLDLHFTPAPLSTIRKPA